MKLKALFALSILFLALSSSEAIINPAGGKWTKVSVVAVTACTAARCPPHGWLTVQLSAAATGTPPDCSRDYRDWVAIDTSEGAGGGSPAVMLHSALMLGTTFTITGTGTCGVDAVIETLGTITESTPRNR